MNFNELLNKMRELDTPASAPVVEKSVEECGEAMPVPNPGMNTPIAKPDTPPPSLSINMNAQGMDDIADIMKLIAKVNPDMEKPMSPPMPSLDASPISIAAPELPPLKMLPDMDSEPVGHSEPDADNFGGPSDMDADNMPGGMDGVSKAQGDLDNDGDHDMDDHEMEPKGDDKEDDDKEDDDDQKKEWANDPDPELKNTDYMVNKLSGGLGRQQTMTSHNYKGGDNPFAMTRESLRASIKAELAQKLEEAKSSHQAKTTMKHIKNPTAGEKKAAKDIKPGVKGYKDRIDMLKSAEKEGRLKEGSSDTVYPNAQVIKSKNGRPVGEIYQDSDGTWGAFHYRADRGADGMDSREDAMKELQFIHSETGRSGPDYTLKGVAEGMAFSQIAKSAGERYGSKERGEKVAGAVLAKLRNK